MGSIVCLIGCMGLALALDQMKGFRAAKNSALIGFATAILGLFFFPIHNVSIAVYFDLLFVTFGASLIFLVTATARSMSSKTRSAR
jgi:multisubunit Na+/H+ antiporter MnhG subunit